MNDILNNNESPKFIYDGECIFCNYFAELTELKGGIPNLIILNGRENIKLLSHLSENGYVLTNGAILIYKDNIYHGESAIQWICEQMNTSDYLLKVLRNIFSSNLRTRLFYSLLLFLRSTLLSIKSVQLNPLDNSGS